jgi:hypothetical protein
MSTLRLLRTTGDLADVDLNDSGAYVRPTGPLRSRVAYAAAHVVPKVHADNTPGQPADIDWDSTLAFRRNVYSWGLGVADAMDTAQRNMGLDAAATRELISRSAEVAREEGGSVVVGVNTDHEADSHISIEQVIAAYLEQLHFTEEQGAGPVLMASRHLARVATGPEDYRRVYREVLSRASVPVVLHWLGTAFDPELKGYFGADDWQSASAVLLEIIEENPDRVAGVKMSLLNAESEISVRSRLPEGVRMFTGDDFNYAELIAGDEQGYSDALLGIFDAIAPAASAALDAFSHGNIASFHDILAPTVPLSRHIFKAPTRFYKTGVVFMAYLNGLQNHFTMIGGQESTRSTLHLADLFRLADVAGLLADPELAASRMRVVMATRGVDA